VCLEVVAQAEVEDDRRVHPDVVLQVPFALLGRAAKGLT
jgi:hypothetical protein